MCKCRYNIPLSVASSFSHTRGSLTLLGKHQGLVDAASSSPDSKNLANCVRYIAFLGTPHHGSDKGLWASTGATLLSYFKETNKELSKSFGERTEKLVKLGKQFPQLLISRAKEGEAALDVVCFYEGRDTHKGGANLGKVSQSLTTTLMSCSHSAC